MRRHYPRSNAIVSPRPCFVLLTCLIPLALAAPVAAQDEAPPPGSAPVVIDLLEGQEPPELDEFAEQQCQRDADAGVIAGEIVVCRERSEPTDGLWSKQDFERRYAEASQGPQPVDVDGTGLPAGMVPLVTIKGCFIGPCPGEPAIMIDVGALPDAPGGSDADRIARGLPPLGEEGDQGRGPISEEELGLPEPDFSR